VEGGWARADRSMARLVLKALLENAWKFTCQKDPATIEVGSLPKEGKTVFFVKDNGAGFDASYANKLFVPFQRLHRDKEYDGCGVGLATVRRIVEKHGGACWAEGATNRGATFYFTLPEKTVTSF
jgi:light-regulated signal transduction histidine kinase (bacteriophytochrome)